jgi:hypothetical protein
MELFGKSIDASLPEATAAFVYWLPAKAAESSVTDNPKRLVAIQRGISPFSSAGWSTMARMFTGDTAVSRPAHPLTCCWLKSVHQREEIETLDQHARQSSGRMSWLSMRLFEDRSLPFRMAFC